ncbi:MAG: ABC transporter ATP-binding protein [Ruminococcaceae bacterium]|nr:ABC transporter ATP-binding protein [Oscillospiraceae bacterium]
MKVLNMKKVYSGKIVLDIKQFDFETGKIYAIVGANGCGKSTFLRMLFGIIKSDDKDVKIDLNGQKACFMPQKNYAFAMNTLNNVLLTSQNKKADTKRAFKLLEELKINNLAKQQANKLSGGETARMALCRVLLSGEKVLLLDEPTAAMDIESTRLSEELLVRVNKEENVTIIFVTHSINQAKRIADKVIFMKDGKVIETGDVDKVLNDPDRDETKEFLEFFSSEV